MLRVVVVSFGEVCLAVISFSITRSVEKESRFFLEEEYFGYGVVVLGKRFRVVVRGVFWVRLGWWLFFVRVSYILSVFVVW